MFGFGFALGIFAGFCFVVFQFWKHPLLVACTLAHRVRFSRITTFHRDQKTMDDTFIPLDAERIPEKLDIQQNATLI